MHTSRCITCTSLLKTIIKTLFKFSGGGRCSYNEGLGKCLQSFEAVRGFGGTAPRWCVAYFNKKHEVRYSSI